MKELNILSWGGGTQSTALMIKMLKGEIKDIKGNPYKLDYIIFADTKAEHKLVYKQIYKVVDYVKKNFNKDIIVTTKNKEKISYSKAERLIENNEIKSYRSSKFADLYQSFLLYFNGIIHSADVMPYWTRNKYTGKVGKTPFKACTFEYKINQMLKELRIIENIKAFDKNKIHLNMFIGYSYDELSRAKPNPKPYATNFSPLIDIYWTKSQCMNYVKNELGFIPKSSVCTFCFANDFEMVYSVFKEDKESWQKLLLLDETMKGKPETHKLVDDVFMFKFQADNNVRLKDIDMEEWYQNYLHDKETGQMSIFDLEQEWGCNEGCFL